MDIEKSMRFLREQDAVFAAWKGKVHALLEQVAVNQAEIEKGQAHWDANMREGRNRGKRTRRRLKRADRRKARMDEMQAKRETRLEALIERIDRLIEILNRRFGTNGTTA